VPTDREEKDLEGTKNMSRSLSETFFFDIETVANKDEKLINVLFPAVEKKTKQDAPKNYKKEETIAKWVEDRYEKDLQERENKINRGALDIDTAIIRSIAFAVGGDTIICLVGEEKQIIKDFLDAWNNFRKDNYRGLSCGYNSINYDWSVILRRVAIFGLAELLLYRPNMNRFTGEIDLMNLAYNFGGAAGQKKGMKTLAKILGIDIPAEGVDGSMVASLTDQELMWYNASDVHVVREIFKKFNGVYL